MCYEYYQRLQRLEDERKRELLEEQERKTRQDRERILQDRPDWKAPEEPVRIREKVPV